MKDGTIRRIPLICISDKEITQKTIRTMSKRWYEYLAFLWYTFTKYVFMLQNAIQDTLYYKV